MDRRIRRLAAVLTVTLGVGVVPTLVKAGKVETWRHDTASALSKAKREKVVLSDLGKVRLARPLEPTAPLTADQVWDLGRTSNGDVYAATGNAGKVFRRVGGAGEWTLAYDSPDSQVFALVALADGTVFAGTGPSGQVVEVTDPKHPASRPDPKVQYVWDLAADPAGNVYAATGPTGQLWKRDRQGGRWSLLHDAKQPHLLSVAVGPDGSVYAGTDGDGLILKVAPDGRASVVHDLAPTEVRVLAFGPDGALYAATAQESGSGSGSGGGFRSGLTFTTEPTGAAGSDGPRTVSAGAAAPARPSSPPTASGGTAAPKSISAGENAVYRVDINGDGVAREIYRQKALFFALAWQDDRLLAGTGPEGQLIEIREGGREAAPIARLDSGQVLALSVGSGGDLLVGTGDPGSVVALRGGYVPAGTLTSDVLDAKLPARVGTVSWSGEAGGPTSVAVELRSGNVGEPDATWTDWAPAGPSASVRSARFFQYRVKLATTDPSVSPEVRGVTVPYQTVNLPPELAKVDVPDVTTGDGSTRLAKINVKWDASDPNGDDLDYVVFARKEGWPDWVRISGEKPITDTSFGWDANALPVGTYRVRVEASDRPANRPTEALSRALTSAWFVVDHEPPTVEVTVRDRVATARLRDGQTRIVKAAYALDGGDWTAAFPAEGLFDSRDESVRFPLEGIGPGAHVLRFRAVDAAGNTGGGDAVFTVAP